MPIQPKKANFEEYNAFKQQNGLLRYNLVHANFVLAAADSFLHIHQVYS